MLINRVNLIFQFLLIFYFGSWVISQKQTCVFTKFSQINFTSLKNDCLNVVIDNLAVPGGETLKLKLREGATLTFKGNTSFEFFEWDQFLVIIQGNNLTVRGEQGSFLDAQGPLYWDGQGAWGTLKPQLMNIKANNSLFENITILNAPKHGITIINSHNSEFKHWLINNSMGDEVFHPDGKFGHNTDGFAVKLSHNISIHDCDVYNQDDCVVVGSGSNIHISHMYCHNSHGLSISTGISNDTIAKNTIKNLTFSDSLIDGGNNGIHIKTRKTGGYGSISDVVYRNIVFKGNTMFGISIQQNYKNTPTGQEMDPVPRGNVPITNLTLENIYGTVNPTAFGIYINCAVGACLNWRFNQVSVSGQANNTCNFTPDNFEC